MIYIVVIIKYTSQFWAFITKPFLNVIPFACSLPDLVDDFDS